MVAPPDGAGSACGARPDLHFQNDFAEEGLQVVFGVCDHGSVEVKARRCAKVLQSRALRVMEEEDMCPLRIRIIVVI